MTLEIALTHRCAEWSELLRRHAYDLMRLEVELQLGEIRLQASRPRRLGGPATSLHVVELWRPGEDPLELGPSPDGCYLHACSWHAQIGGAGSRVAERFDLDRSKPPVQMRHRHPYGQPNNIREPMTASTPAAWLLRLDTILSSLY